MKTKHSDAIQSHLPIALNSKTAGETSFPCRYDDNHQITVWGIPQYLKSRKSPANIYSENFRGQSILHRQGMFGRVSTITNEHVANHLRLIPATQEGSVIEKNFLAPNFGNDYSNTFVHQNVLPQSWVRNIEHPLEGYPKLAQLHELKRKHFNKHADFPIGIRCQKSEIASEIEKMHSRGANFDVVMIGGCTSGFSVPHLKTLNIGSLTPRPSLLFLWVPSDKVAEGRQLMDSWGFRRGEDIIYMLNSLNSVHRPQNGQWIEKNHLFVPTTWHCLMGLKGTLRRSIDNDLINCNIDTDVIIESPSQKVDVVPEQIYNLIENFTSMKRKIFIMPFETCERLPVRPRKGWVTLAPDVFTLGNFNAELYRTRTLIPFDGETDKLRPKTPPNQR